MILQRYSLVEGTPDNEASSLLLRYVRDMATIRDKVGHLETLPIDLLSTRISMCPSFSITWML
jgi:hypothetical protein